MPDTPASSSTPADRGRAFLLLLSIVVIALVLRYAIRPAVLAAASPELAAVVELIPEFLMGLGFPFIWLLFNTRNAWPYPNDEFKSACALTIAFFFLTRDSGETFNYLELGVLTAGVFAAYGLYRLLFHRDPADGASPTEQEPSLGVGSPTLGD